MATVPSASPRPSISLLRSPASSRTSLDIVSDPSSTSRGGLSAPARRDRAALREYYRLKATGQSSATPSILSPTSDVGASLPPTRLEKLDRNGFDAGSFVREILEVEGLEGLLALENELVGEVRSLDGERKALVYDNYSKLITATDTIKKMRSNMDPLAPATITLAPTVAHIAETAVGLASELETIDSPENIEASLKKQKQQALLQRALRGPETLQALLDQDLRAKAEAEWTIIQSILGRCGSATGCQELKDRCENIMSLEEDDSD